MSSKGIFTALSGSIAQSRRMDTIANNIANASTTGFKKDKQTFYEYVTANEKTPDTINLPRITASLDSFYDMQGGDRGYVDSAGTFTDFSQGGLKATGNPLDLAIEGDAFLEVLSPSGVKLTRSGNLKVDSQGRLVNSRGYFVLKSGLGQPPESRVINLNSSKITIAYNGEIYESGQLNSKLSLVKPQNLDSLKKVGNALYAFKDNLNSTLSEPEEAKVHQGFLESSNVNIVEEMTKMISASRSFESSQKIIQAFDEMNQKLVNEVPKT